MYKLGIAEDELPTTYPKIFGGNILLAVTAISILIFLTKILSKKR